MCVCERERESDRGTGEKEGLEGGGGLSEEVGKEVVKLQMVKQVLL